MHELSPLISDLAIMLGVASLVILIFQRIRQPVVLGYLVAGMILGPYTPPRSLISSGPSIQILSELGVIFLMFSLGLEFSFHKLMRVGFSATITGTVKVVLLGTLGYFVGILLGWSHYNSLFLGASLSVSSTTIILKAMEELGLKTKRFAELVFGVLIVEDLLAILLLVGLSTIVMSQNVFSSNMVFASGKLIFVVVGWFLVGYFIVPSLFRHIAKYISQETLTIFSIALCLFLVNVAAHFHYSTALGAFIMGSILAETLLVRRIEELVQPIRDIFAAVFFITVGMLINPWMIIENWQAVIIVSLITIVGSILVTTFAALFTGQSLNTSVRMGFSMGQIGEFSFIIATLGLSLKVTTYDLYSVIVAVAAITTFCTPYLIRFSGYVSLELEKRLPERTKYFLASYSAWVFRTLTTSSQQSFFGSVTSRVFLNGILVAIIFMETYQFIFPHLFKTLENIQLAKMTGLFIALMLASPFIWGMMFSYRRIKLPEYAKTYLNPAIFMVWLLTLAEIFILSVIYFHTWIATTIFVTIAAVFFGISYRHLERSYHWFERQLISNIKSKSKSKSSRYEELAPWDTHFVEMKVGKHSPFIGKTFTECQIRQLYGVTIVAIYRGVQIIAAPRGTEMVLAQDRLIVLGNDKQIDAFKKRVEIAGDDDEEQLRFLEEFTLKAILLEKGHPLIGKTIRSSKIRESINGLVVGLERHNQRILNPVPETELKDEDLLLIVGETDKIQAVWRKA